MAITDAFTGTNGTGIAAYSANWAYMLGSGTNLQIQSNGLCVVTGSIETAAKRTEAAGFPSAHYAQATLALAGGGSIGVAVRCQGSGTGDYYGFYGDTSVCQLFENDNTTWTQLGSNGAAFATTNVIRLSVSGTTLTPNKNGSTTGTPGAQTDATFSNGAPGVAGWNAGATTDQRIDDFECTDASAAGSTRGMAFGSRGTAFNGGRALRGIIARVLRLARAERKTEEALTC